MSDATHHILMVVGRSMTFMMAWAFLTLEAAQANDAKLVPPDPWEIIHTARDYGSAEVGRDHMRDPLIKGEIDGLVYEIAFYGCWLGRNCESVLFQAKFAREEWEPDQDDLTVWNQQKLVGRAWLLDDESAMLDHAVAMHGGLPKKTLAAAFDTWAAALREYAEHLDFQ